MPPAPLPHSPSWQVAPSSHQLLVPGIQKSSTKFLHPVSQHTPQSSPPSHFVTLCSSLRLFPSWPGMAFLSRSWQFGGIRPKPGQPASSHDLLNSGKVSLRWQTSSTNGSSFSLSIYRRAEPTIKALSLTSSRCVGLAQPSDLLILADAKEKSEAKLMFSFERNLGFPFWMHM